MDFGGFHSSLTVPPLLGAFYAVIGSLHIFLDWLAASSPEPADSPPPSGIPQPLWRLLQPLANFLQTDENANQTEEVFRERTSFSAVALVQGKSLKCLDIWLAG